MAFNINLYKFQKRGPESTKRPTGSGTQLSGEIKEPSSIMAPTIIFSASVFSDPTAYNYAYIAKFKRYYFITDVRWILGRWEVSMRCDVLATYKSEIGSKTMYMLRASASNNGNIVDHLYPTASISYGSAEDDSFIPLGYGLGSYIVNVVGVATGGTSTLWKLSPANFRALISALYANIDGFQFTDIIEALRKVAGGSPEKLVSSAMWMPPYNFPTSGSQEIIIGTWESGISGDLISDPLFELPAIELTLPKHPQAASRGSFLNLSPYSTYTLNIPMFGAVNLDTTAIKNASSIFINIVLDALSGQGRCRVHSGGNPRPLLADLVAQIGVAVPLQGQSAGASVAGSVVSTLAATAGAIASGGAALPIIGASGAALGTAITALSGASFSTGSAGGALSFQHAITLDATFLNIAPEDNAEHGRPLCDLRTPASLGGYCLPKDAHVDIPGTSEEQTELARICEGGFFYE